MEKKPRRQNSPERVEMLANRHAEQRARVPRFTRVLGRKSLSLRGERGETWRTKSWTAARWRDLAVLEAPNLDLAERLDGRFVPIIRRLKAHLALHPADATAIVALARAEA